MHLNRKKYTIPELCLNFHELLQKIYVIILEVRSPEKTLQVFGKKKVFLGTYYEISSVSNEKTYHVCACTKSY